MERNYERVVGQKKIMNELIMFMKENSRATSFKSYFT